MEIKDLRQEYKDIFETHSDLNSDFFIIVSYVTKVNVSGLTPYVDVDDKMVRKIRKLMSRHLKGEPIEKIIGYSIFYDCIIPYSRHTLTPRMETELLVERVIKDIKHKTYRVLDMCCGSGCIGIAIAKNTSAKVVCADISKYAMAETKSNAKANYVKVETKLSDMFASIEERFDCIICNPPYIPQYEYEKLDNIVKNFDPKLALVAEDDGLEYYKKIASEAHKYLKPNGKLYLEIGYNQGDSVKALLEANFEEIEVIKDYGGNDRIVVAKVKVYN